MNITISIEDFKKLISDHEFEISKLQVKIFQLESQKDTVGFTDEDLEDYATYVESEERLKHRRELEARKQEYFTDSGTDDI